MSTCRDLFGSVNAELDCHKELKEVFNTVFDSCMPNSDDEVMYLSLLDALVSMQSSNDKEAALLKNEFNHIFRRRRGSWISRREFLKYLIAAKKDTEHSSPSNLAEPMASISPIETYECNGRKSSSSEGSELQDLERSFSSLPSSVNSALPREREINLYLMRMGILKDRKITKMEKELDDLRREMNLCIQNEEALNISYSKKIHGLKEQLRDANENYVLCSKKADKLDEVEHELYERTQQKIRLEKQLEDLEGEYDRALGQIHSLDEQLKILAAENGKLKDKLQDQDALCLKLEQLREEKQELQANLVNVSMKMCPNLLEDVSEDEFSPDRMLMSFPARERGMSLDEELSLLPEPFKQKLEESTSDNVDDHPICSFLPMEDKSTSCSDLIADVLELRTMTEINEDESPPRVHISMGTQTEAQQEDGDRLPAPTCQRQKVNTHECWSQTGLVLMISKRNESKSTQTEQPLPEIHPNGMAGNHTESSLQLSQSYMDPSSTSSLSTSIGASDILHIFMHTVILLVIALVFCIFLINFDNIMGYVCNGVANFARNSIKFRYRGIPPH